MSKRYYWLKLKEDFFRQIAIKKLRKIAGGDTFTIIYLKILLIAIKTDGILGYDCLGYDCSEQEFTKTLAIDIDEDEGNVAITISFLLRNNLLIPVDSDTSDMYMPEAAENIGSEADSTERSRRCRQKQKALQCNANATLVQREREKENEKEKESLPPTPPMKEKEKVKEKEKAKKTLNTLFPSLALEESSNSVDLDIKRRNNNNITNPRAREKEPSSLKKQYAEFVKMTEEEYNKLIERFGDEELAKEAIEVLDNYKGSSGKTYKSDYRAILTWVEREVKERHVARPMKAQAQTPQEKMQGILDRYLARKEQESGE